MASMVSLPSIHEGFPDIDFREPPLPGSYPLSRPLSGGGYGPICTPANAPRAHPRQSYMSPYHQSSYPARESHFPYVHDASDHFRDGMTYSPPRHPAHSTPRGALPGPSYPRQPSPSFTQPSVSHHHHHAETPASSSFRAPRRGTTSAAAAAAAAGRKLPSTATYSFDVLRSEPGTVSLEHIASSKTLQNRSSNAPRHISPTGVANGSAPAFRVALPTLAGGPSDRADQLSLPLDTFDQSYGAGGVHSNDDDDGRQSPATSPADSTESPSVVSFSMSDGSNVSKLSVDDSGRSYFQEPPSGGLFRVDGRGKKHQCPQCPKRFNRPSSLRIHVNTHTGARPFQCPYPNCGREFNVNSNMRRHYRNHSMAATAEVHPPRHNSGRRPRGYPRPHPGRSSRLIFHLSPGHPAQSVPSTASMTDDDDDSDMEQDLRDGDLNGYDNGDVYDETEEEEEEEEEEGMRNLVSPTHKSVTWSPSQSPTTVDHDRTRLYQDLQSHHVVAPPCTSSPQFPQSPTTSSHTYTPSSPAYVRACRDPTVSTTLRPAFR